MLREAAESCIATCKCVPIHNCGQYNQTGVISCGKNITEINVCAECNLPWLTPGPSMQGICDGCFNEAAPPAGKGCGGK